MEKLEKVEKRREKENKNHQGSFNKELQISSSKTFAEITERSMVSDSFIGSDRTEINELITLRQSDNKVNMGMGKSHQVSSERFNFTDNDWKD